MNRPRVLSPTVRTGGLDREDRVLRKRSPAGRGRHRGWRGAPLALLSAAPARGSRGAKGGSAAPPAGEDEQAQALLQQGIWESEGGLLRRYVWDGRSMRAVEECEDLGAGSIKEGDGGVAGMGRFLQARGNRILFRARAAFVPEDVTEDYFVYARWRFIQRVFSSMIGVLSTQAMLQAIGVGAKRSVPAAASLNWVLKDGLGKLGKLVVATRFGRSFDSDLKRFRFSSTVLFLMSQSLELWTPLYPQHFLLMASIANVGKSVGLACTLATAPAFNRSFAQRENIADITAKLQAQTVVADNLGLAAAVGLSLALQRRPGGARLRVLLPLALYPPLAALDLYSVYKELRAVHLRTLNKERAELIAETWIAERRVPAPKEVSEMERYFLPPRIGEGAFPLHITSLGGAVSSRADLAALLRRHEGQRFVLGYRAGEGGGVRDEDTAADSRGRGRSGERRGGMRRPSLSLALRHDMAPRDVLTGVLQAAHLRSILGAGAGEGGKGAEARGGAAPTWAEVERAVSESHRLAARDVGVFVRDVGGTGWQLEPFMLATAERVTYKL